MNSDRRDAPFAGVRPVIHTPFGKDDVVDHSALALLVGRMLDFEVPGVVALGLASEAWTLTEFERDAACATVAESLNGHTPMVVGIDGTTSVASDRARKAGLAGAAGLMVLPPAAARTPDLLVAHFSSVADAAGVPILVQDSPQVTGITLTLETLLAMKAANPLVGAVKIEAPAAGPKVTALVGAGFDVVSGWGGLHYPEALRRGVVGCMPGCDLAPALLQLDALGGADWRASDDLYRRILPLLSYEAQSLELLILGAKRALMRTGVFSSGSMRSPAMTLDPEQESTIDSFFDQLEQEGVPGWLAR